MNAFQPAAWKRLFQERHTYLRERLRPHFPVQIWIEEEKKRLDLCLIDWAEQHLQADEALYALGGYGRGECFPASDLDFLIVSPRPETLTSALNSLWQTGLRISPRILRPDEILDLARQDLHFLTSLLDYRRLFGTEQQWHVRQIVTVPDFVRLKIEEQQQRDADAWGCLEPHLKNDVGALRDIHTMRWLHQYSGISPHFSRQQWRSLRAGRLFLQRLRFALHLHERSDVLRFAQQKALALRLTSQGDALQAVEHLMRDYYRHQRRIRQLNQQYATQLRHSLQSAASPKRFLDADFYIQNKLLYFKGKLDLSRLWQCFLHWQRHPEIEDLAPDLARQMAAARGRLFPRKKALIRQHFAYFRQLLQRYPVYPVLHHLHRYGLLQRVIPDFWGIVGQMQFDLFHQYTVDQHSLRLLLYLDRFQAGEEALYPEAHRLMQQLKHRDMLYFAALLHDMGKGRGGDHSEIGAQLAQRYAHFGGLNAEESALLQFWVRHHLTFSQAAQKQDIYDSKVQQELRALLPRPEALDAWYLLTLADISATNSTLWNSWRAQLMWQLYQQLKQPPPLPEEHSSDVLRHCPREFFHGKHKALLARQILALQHEALPLVHVMGERLLLASELSTPLAFAIGSHWLERHSAAVVEARFYRLRDGRQIQDYRLQEALPLHGIQDLRAQLAAAQAPPPLKKRFFAPCLHEFKQHIDLEWKKEGERWRLLLSCPDRHGLLSCLSRVFLSEEVALQHAKINTLGDRAEDSFAFSDLNEAQRRRLQYQILQALADFYRAL